MGMCTVAGVDDGSLGMAADDSGDAAVLVAHDDVIHVHAHERVDGVVHALTLYDRRRGHGESGHVCLQAAGCQLKRGAGAGARLVEEREHRFAGQSRGGLAAAEYLLHFGGTLQNAVNVSITQRINGK